MLWATLTSGCILKADLMMPPNVLVVKGFCLTGGNNEGKSGVIQLGASPLIRRLISSNVAFLRHLFADDIGVSFDIGAPCALVLIVLTSAAMCSIFQSRPSLLSQTQNWP